MPLTEITDVQYLTPDPDLVRAFAIDIPLVGTAHNRASYQLDGWVLGRSEPAVAIDVACGNEIVGRLKVDQARPDVVASYDGAPALCGFRGLVPVHGLAAELTFEVRSVFADWSEAPLATIRGRRLGLPQDPSEWPLLEPPASGSWPHVELDQPDDGDDLGTGCAVTGWAFSPVGIKHVSIWLDGELLGLATYGLDREDVGRQRPDWPAAPRSGFHLAMERLPAPVSGSPQSTLEVIVEDWVGRLATLPRSVVLAEPPPLPTFGSLDQPKDREDHDVLWEAGWFGQFIVYGWAVDPAGVDRVDVLIDGQVVATAEYGLPRSDVDMVLPEFRQLGLTAQSGWLALIPTAGLAPGKHSIAAVLHGGSGSLPIGQTEALVRQDDVRADPTRQRRLDALLRCPKCGHGLGRNTAGLVCDKCRHRIPTSEYGTLLFDETYAGLDWREAFSTTHLYPPPGLELIEDCRDGLVLEVGAGLHTSLPNVIQLDAIAYPTTDVSANGEDMPFADESFDGVIACNLLEHVTSPAKVVAEMRRVCKVGGRIYADFTTVHPYHGFPYHYFNATESGLTWLMAEIGGSAGRVEPADTRDTIRMVLQSWLGSFENDQTRRIVADLRVGDLVDLLRDPSRSQTDRERFDALDELTPLGRRLIPPKMIFSGKRVR